jgi:hypothetical protein
MFFDPTVRVLHPFQALIYVAIIYLARRRSAYGFGAGCIMAAFWNYIFLVGAHKEIWTFLRVEPVESLSHFNFQRSSLPSFWWPRA